MILRETTHKKDNLRRQKQKHLQKTTKYKNFRKTKKPRESKKKTSTQPTNLEKQQKQKTSRKPRKSKEQQNTILSFFLFGWGKGACDFPALCCRAPSSGTAGFNNNYPRDGNLTWRGEPDNFGSWDNSKRTAQEESSGSCKATDSRSLPNYSRNHHVCGVFFNLYRLAMFGVSTFLQVCPQPIKLQVGQGLLLCIFWAIDLRTLEVSDPLKPEPMSGLTRVTCGAWVSWCEGWFDSCLILICSLCCPLARLKTTEKTII